MYHFWFALFTTVILTECAPRGTPEVDDSQPISPEDYQVILGQGYTTNYFKSKKLAVRYRTENIQDVYDKGFRNLRIHSRADLFNTTSETRFQEFLTTLTEVVDECLRVGVAPVISWIHHEAEANATEEHRQNYLDWWKRVALELKDRSYNLSFNLFNELGVDKSCGDMCADSLRVNKEKYNNWTQEVVWTIRATDGKNAQRILILGSPDKKSNGLVNIDPSIYTGDPYMMVEWHHYAAGPYKYKSGLRFWSGNGSEEQRQTLRDDITIAKNFTRNTSLLSYFAEWMPKDNEGGSLDQSEVIAFA